MIREVKEEKMTNKKFAECNESPLVTVYMPTHNRVELLKRAVESVLTQTYKNIELIVVDDKSTDSTLQYLEKISKKDSRVRFFRNKKNSGACVSRNKAIFAAKGEFITGLDDDDYFINHHIYSCLSKWVDKSSSTVAIYSDVYQKKESGIQRAFKKLKKCRAEQLIHANLIGNQIFTKTKILKSYGGFDPRFPALQDLDCWYNLLLHTEGVAECTGVYSYVLDLSHAHERISNKKIEVIKEACEIFCNKYSFDCKREAIFKILLVNYEAKLPRFSSVLDSLILWPSLYNLKKKLNIYVKCFRDILESK